MERDYWRQLDFYDPQKRYKVLVCGCGSIGSHVAYGLLQMGVYKVTVVDFDVVKPHNLPQQFFMQFPGLSESIPKVNAFQKTMRAFLGKDADKRLVIYEGRAEDMEYPLFDVVIVTVDDMDVRKLIWRKVTKAYDEGHKIGLIDVRTGGEFVNVYSIYRETQNYYEESLYSNEEAVDLPCTGTAVADVTMGASAEAIQRFRQYARNRSFKVHHTFHDYRIGISHVLYCEPPKEEVM